MVDKRIQFLNDNASKLALQLNLSKDKEFIFIYDGVHCILHYFKDKWRVSYTETDKYWFDFIEDKIFDDLTDIINSL